MKEDLREELKKLEVSDNHIKSVVDNLNYNVHIGEYYKRLSAEKNNEMYMRKFFRLADCNSIWEMAHWQQQKAYEFKKTNLCKDKFCNNCKKVRQAAKLGKFKPLLMPYKANMYQVTFTMPNVPGEQLSEAIDKLLKGYAKLIGYLKGKKKVKGVDFTKFNYKGSIRSLEVTIPKGNEYHPHLHALMVFEGYEGWKELKHQNQYSFNRKKRNEIRLFSDEEILIQKIWYLILNGEKVTLKNIEALEVGYSCRIDKFKESDFIELFKYMTKSTTEYDKVISYEQFKTLYFALDGRRQIQGYGCFYNLKDDDDFSLDEALEIYNSLIEKLQEIEKSVEVSTTPTDLMEIRKNDNDVIVFSRKKIHAAARELQKKNNR